MLAMLGLCDWIRMEKTLVVGCSFLGPLQVNTSKVKVIGVPGAGNNILAEIVLHELSKNNYTRVCILWTGLNRLDIPISAALSNTYNQDYPFKIQIGSTVWYASGGINMTMSNDSKCPNTIKKIFKDLYLAADSEYLTNQSLSAVVKVQSYLKSNSIDHSMSFIYDIHSDVFNWLNNVLGKVNTSAYCYQLIDWNSIQLIDTPFEWAKLHSRLTDDRFHPTNLAMIEWIGKNFHVDLSNSGMIFNV